MDEIIRIPDIDKYDQSIVDGTLLLTPKKIYIEEFEMFQLSLTHSKILQCCIRGEEIITEKNKYQSILIDIWEKMLDSPKKIFQNTTFNFKLTKEKGEKGYNWEPRINMSFQSKDSVGTMKEIIKMVRVNNYSLDISIELGSEESKRIIHFKI